MSELDKALDRLGRAVSHLVASGGQGDLDAAEARIAELMAERDALRAEIDELKAQREADARLRAEAADAVKAALRDLRSLVTQQAASAEGGRHA